MRIAYLTVDEVNSDLARRWATEFQCEIVPLSPCDPLPIGEYDATIYDLDYLAPSLIQRVLTNLLTGSLPRPAVVHSYNLRPRQANDLQARGVFVRQRLERGILALLRREVQRLRSEKQTVQEATIASSQCNNLDSNAISTSWVSLQG
jgi:hypothetical protein